MAKHKRSPVVSVPVSGDVPVVGMREPCPCGSGRRYKACHGRSASHAATELVLRPFEGLALLFHTGTSGIGAGQPGGQGIRLDYSRPIRLDAVAAAFPNLNVIAAHFGFPWHMELLAMALHKTNIHIDISGWAPKYIPAEVIRELKGRLQNQFVFGSDYPFIQPQRCLDELEELQIPDAALQKVLTGNGKRLLGLS